MSKTFCFSMFKIFCCTSSYYINHYPNHQYISTDRTTITIIAINLWFYNNQNFLTDHTRKEKKNSNHAYYFFATSSRLATRTMEMRNTIVTCFSRISPYSIWRTVFFVFPTMLSAPGSFHFLFGLFLLESFCISLHFITFSSIDIW